MAAALSPAMYEVLAEVARAADAAGHGGRTAVYERAARELGISRATLIARLRAVRYRAPRKRRADAGQCALSAADAQRIAAVLEETRRQTGTGTAPLEHVLAVLRAEQPTFACRLDESTGELVRLSLSAIRRAMQQHGVHPEQLARPTPATRLSSPHPNWCWQIDASLSRQFYLAEDGAEVLDVRQFYPGKPANMARINDRRLWRYVITDHASGYVYVHYCQGAESTANLITALIAAMVPREGESLHGIPRIVMSDPGPGTKSAAFRNFVEALGMRHIPNQRGNARAKGQVENGNSLVNTHFEAMLRLRAPVKSVAEMQALAAQWCRWFNATRDHTRHGMTRRDAWLLITPEQLVRAPSVDVLRVLAVSAPTPCVVRDGRVRFKSGLWDVSGMPGLINGQKVEVLINPLDHGFVRVLAYAEDGRAQHYLAPRIALQGPFGFEAGAAEIGSTFRAAAETPTDAARKAVERLAMDAATDAEAEAGRKAKRLAFDGRLDPMATMRTELIPPALPRAGTASQVTAPDVLAPTPLLPAPALAPAYVPRLLSHTEMALNLKHRLEALGATWTAATWARMTALWPAGVNEEQLDACAVQLLRGGLHVVGEAP